MSFGITEIGFVRKTRDDIVAAMTDNTKTLLGNDIDLSPYSEDMLRLQLTADELDNLWQLAEFIYYSNYAHTASGVSLDRVVSQRIVRSKAKRSIVSLNFTGVEGADIPVGTICETSQGVQFITITMGTITGGTATVSAQALQEGSDGNIPAETIKTIVTPRTGITTVTNLGPATGGRERETDLELRQRYFEGGNDGGSSPLRLQSLLGNLPSVNLAIVYENATDYIDLEGRPPHSMEAVIDGGSATELTDLFLKNWPGGIESYGSERIDITDNKGIPRTWYYNTPQDVDIYVDINVITDPQEWLPSGNATIITNCIKVVGGIDGTIPYNGNGIGADVFAWQLIAAQAGLKDYDTIKVPGIKSMTVKVGTAPSPTDNEVVISGRQRAKLITANITVSVV